MEYLIIGGGLSGLALANTLHKAGRTFQMLEATDRVGGRVKTDKVEGFLLDRGFQVYLTAYPEGLRQLDLKALRLKSFTPGARLMMPDGSQELFVDPSRRPAYVFKALASSAGDFGDKLSLFSLSRRLSNKRNRALFCRENKTTAAILKEYGFSESLIQHFLQPFYAGIFLEDELQTSRRMFDFVLKMFTKGDGAVPSLGMEEIPKQMAANLPSEAIRCHAKVVEIDGQRVTTESGETYTADKIIIATEVNQLLQSAAPGVSSHANAVTCLYFSADKAPYKEPIIGLLSSRERFVNNVAVMSNVSEAYAPKGKSLIAVSVNGLVAAGDDTIERVRKDLRPYFGEQVDVWKHLKTYAIPYALPDQRSVQYDLDPAKAQLRSGLYMCGDHMLQGSINAAMKAGRQLGEHLLSQS